MSSFSLLLEADALDERIVRTIAETMGDDDIAVLETWRCLDRATGEPVDDDAQTSSAPARIRVEWIRRKGRFGLDLEIWGVGVRTDVSQAELAREFVRRLGAPALLSDCSHFGFSWLMHRIDGSIWEVVSNTDDIDDFDLYCDLAPDHSDFTPAILVWPADKPLPLPGSADASARWRACEGESAASFALCRHFATPYCPKHRRE
jgi:hypothetical protein